MAKYKQGDMGRKGGKGKGDMGHEKKPMPCDAFAAQKKDMGRLQKDPQGNRGYPEKAWEYKY